MNVGAGKQITEKQGSMKLTSHFSTATHGAGKQNNFHEILVGGPGRDPEAFGVGKTSLKSAQQVGAPTCKQPRGTHTPMKRLSEELS